MLCLLKIIYFNSLLLSSSALLGLTRMACCCGSKQMSPTPTPSPQTKAGHVPGDHGQMFHKILQPKFSSCMIFDHTSPRTTIDAPGPLTPKSPKHLLGTWYLLLDKFEVFMKFGWKKFEINSKQLSFKVIQYSIHV